MLHGKSSIRWAESLHPSPIRGFERNYHIFALRHTGLTLRAAGEPYSLSAERVRSICASVQRRLGMTGWDSFYEFVERAQVDRPALFSVGGGSEGRATMVCSVVVVPPKVDAWLSRSLRDALAVHYEVPLVLRRPQVARSSAKFLQSLLEVE